MKIYSNTPIPPIQKWKPGEWLFAINLKDNRESAEGKRYEADFTIVKGESEEEALKAFHRMFHDPEHDQEVIDNIEIEGQKAIDIEKTYSPELPSIKSIDVLNDNDLIKTSQEITSEIVPVDTVIEKVAGKVENYVIDLSAGQRTAESDQFVQQLIDDNNIIITEQ